MEEATRSAEYVSRAPARARAANEAGTDRTVGPRCGRRSSRSAAARCWWRSRTCAACATLRCCCDPSTCSPADTSSTATACWPRRSPPWVGSGGWGRVGAGAGLAAECVAAPGQRSKLVTAQRQLNVLSAIELRTHTAQGVPLQDALRAEVDDLVASECLFCGEHIIR